MKKEYQQFSGIDGGEAMAQILTKVAEESCLWVSGHSLGYIEIRNSCTNYLRMPIIL